jgi:penicillin-binding protein 1A
MRNIVRLFRIVCWFLISGLAGAGVIAASFYIYFSPHLPAVGQLREVQLETPLRLFSHDHKLIAEFGEKRRTPIEIADVPRPLLDAFLAAEDSRFYEHQGVDFKGILRAALQLISTGSIQTGGSTITMQAAKNYFLSQERTFTRKFKEILLAFKIEQALEKDEIFELYLNKIYLGNRAYGVEAAANVYYGKPVSSLSLAQMAMIAGLPKAPSKYNPLASPDRAVVRRNWILDRMLELSMITPEQNSTAKSAPVTASYHGTKPEIEAPYIAEMARQEIVNLYGVDAYNSGLQVILTIDSKMQAAADAALKKGLLDYSRRHGFKGVIGKIDPALLTDHPKALAQILQYTEARGVVPGIVTNIGEQSASILTRDNHTVEIDWDGLRWANPYFDVNKQGKRPTKTSQIMSTGDVVYVSQDSEGYKLAQLPDVQGALVAVSPGDGAILALVGGFDFYISKFNRATQAQRQPGSNFKPFVYLSALENGSTAATLINDAPVVFEDSNLETSWRPENYSEKFYGPTRLRKALYLSRNLVSIRLLQKTGVSKTVDYIERFGFERRRIPNNLSLALGSAAFTPLEIATGYATLANGGYRIQPYLIESIVDQQSKTLFVANPARACEQCTSNEPVSVAHTEGLVIDVNSEESITASAVQTAQTNIHREDNQETLNIAERISDPRAVYILNSILQDVINKGTGMKAKSLRRSDLAGKTGTTNDQVDAWFSGYNGNIAATVWVGFDQPSTLGKHELGGKTALPVWIDFMKIALEGTPEAPMKQPPGLVTVKIDENTGKRAMPGQSDTIFEIFREEQAPNTLTNSEISRESILSSTKEDSSPEIIF